MSRFAVCCSLAFLLACGAAQPSTADPEWGSVFVGTWQGVGEQYPEGMAGERWPMVVQIEHIDPGPCGTVTYPSLDCSGTWICQPGFEGDVLEIRERITEGADRCTDNGSITLTARDDGTLAFRYASGDVRAGASLSPPLPETPRE